MTMTKRNASAAAAAVAPVAAAVAPVAAAAAAVAPVAAAVAPVAAAAAVAPVAARVATMGSIVAAAAADLGSLASDYGTQYERMAAAAAASPGRDLGSARGKLIERMESALSGIRAVSPEDSYSHLAISAIVRMLPAVWSGLIAARLSEASASKAMQRLSGRLTMPDGSPILWSAKRGKRASGQTMPAYVVTVGERPQENKAVRDFISDASQADLDWLTGLVAARAATLAKFAAADALLDADAE